jgi:hypothetical protein
MEFNYYALLAATFVPLIVGAFWYHPKVAGAAWMKACGFSEADLAKSNMFKIFGLTLVFSFFLTFVVMMLTVHQLGPVGMIGGPQFAEAAKPSFHAFMEDYGMAFRTFKHGALHGFMSGLFFAFPLIAINGLFERRSWKYIFIHTGYWTLVLTIMGAIICGWV